MRGFSDRILTAFCISRTSLRSSSSRLADSEGCLAVDVVAVVVAVVGALDPALIRSSCRIRSSSLLLEAVLEESLR